MRAAAKLQLVKDQWEEASSAEKDEALTYNRKIWTILVTSATADDNPLPQDIKDNLGSLGIFIFSQTLDIMLDGSAEKLTSLVSINRNIAEGLRAKAPLEDAATE